MHHAVRDDRLWFQTNPAAIVRFRNASPGEFTPLVSMGDKPPFFGPACAGLGPPCFGWPSLI